MPGWHEATKELQERGELQMLGIIQEQHPERAKLFMQWKQMDWPILVDSFNVLEVQLVPITLAIDEHGVIRHKNLSTRQAQNIEQLFLNQDYDPPAVSGAAKTERPDLEQLHAAAESGGAQAWRDYADALALWGGSENISAAVEAYEHSLHSTTSSNGNGPPPAFSHEFTHFRKGVAHRMRYDSDKREAHDFQAAVAHWQKSLDINPNNYITRRRIQQYGPRLAKPYPFYDWVPKAQSEIAARGEISVSLKIKPAGAEFAHPRQTFETAKSTESEPDPKGRIHRDKEGFIDIETVVVPSAVAAGGAARVHVIMRPNSAIKAHWNNEVEDLVFWINPPQGWEVDSQYQTVPNAGQVVSNELRTVEFEIKAQEEVPSGRARFSGYALYYVCEDVNGVCLYRRQDVAFDVEVD